ncbi:MAG: hypothetical protein AABY10_06095 [Nanoarchaeota archaeon]
MKVSKRITDLIGTIRNLRDLNLYDREERREIVNRFYRAQRISGNSTKNSRLAEISNNLVCLLQSYVIISFDLPIAYFCLPVASYWFSNKMRIKGLNDDFISKVNTTSYLQRQIMSGESISERSNNYGLDKLLGGSQ